MTLLQRFRALPIDFEAIGLIQRSDNDPYFCTPLGADIIGWAGVDGIHYCTVPGLGETVFAVAPMDLDPYVNPIARNFEEFLRLLITTKDLAAVQQAYMWDREGFDRFTAENPPLPKAEEAIGVIRNAFSLEPIADPYGYITRLQALFSPSLIPWSEEYYDVTGLTPPKPKSQQWKVFFDHTKEDEGILREINASFTWGEEEWTVPAAYICRGGIVLDMFASASYEKVKEYIDKWFFLPEEELEKCADDLRESDPLSIHFRLHAEINGKRVGSHHGSLYRYIPRTLYAEKNSFEQKLCHYGFDLSQPWFGARYYLSWPEGESSLDSFNLRLERDPHEFMGPAFTTPGTEAVSFAHPLTGEEYTLTVTELEQGSMDPSRLPLENFEIPTCYTAICYTLSPEAERRTVTVRDLSPGDRPRPIPKPAPGGDPLASKYALEPQASAAIGIIGGADGPTAIGVLPASRGRNTSCSSIYFERPDTITWGITWNIKLIEDAEVKLI